MNTRNLIRETNKLKSDKIPRIAILGSRGIPSEFGGFETFAEELSTRLVKKGFRITVFCEDSQSYKKDTYLGVKLKFIHTPKIVGVRSIWGDTLSIIKSLREYDIIYMLGYHVAFSFIIPKLAAKILWTNMDGLEWKRKKWSFITKLYLKTMERLAYKYSSIVIADSKEIKNYLQHKYKYHHRIITIPYGAYLVSNSPDTKYIKDLGLRNEGYYLVVCRLEPENHVYEIIKGFTMSNSKKMLILVGNQKSATKYVKRLREFDDARVHFVGPIYHKKRLESLRYYCYAYFHGHSVGGTNPSLLEAMACKNFIIAHDNIFNREVTDNFAWYFRSENDVSKLVEKLETEGKPMQICKKFKDIILNKYNWDIIADKYIALITHGFTYNDNA